MRPFWIKFVAYLIILTMVISTVLFSLAFAI
ncbi:stressosome-associated protein Prli42 [Polycladomyces subterraneus]|uniref:Stressosome-associated protein Prli42 n=1 Tax=Polycladomyces subterraneus TaxID=1016997 RepID=A0ABT8IMT5_9BACL|nr:stressosome-associated protein Prli42 [Polycladomyces subterraneus]MDN4594108.1 stressosome-associated protein Prli42 [Polycladomyces subterraneus]